jgi:ParB family chromosome partitioning protein
LLSAADDVKHAVVNEVVSEGHARALLALTSMRAQESALRTVLKQDLNVRQTEVLVKKLQGYAPGKKKKKGLNPDLLDLQERLQSRLGTRVSLRHAKKGGTLTIHYYSDEELDAIMGKLLK